jgi:hypothetical protein
MTTTLFQFVMLALVASIHVLDTACDQWCEGVDGRDKPDHDGKGGVMDSRLRPESSHSAPGNR